MTKMKKSSSHVHGKKPLLWKVKLLIASIMLACFMESCWKDKNFYIKDIDVSIDIEKNEGDYNFRVYVYKNVEDRGMDYIDIHYDMGELPSIELCFPPNQENNVYIIDARHDIYGIKSSKFNFTRINWKRISNNTIVSEKDLDSIHRTLELADSIRSNTIRIQLGSGLIKLNLYQNNNYKGPIFNNNR